MVSRRYPNFPIPGVGAVVIGEKGILLVRRDKEPSKGLWSIPGGAVEVGETQLEAVKREVLEETGVHCEVLDLVTTVDVMYSDDEGGIEFHYLINHYLAEAKTNITQQESPEAEVLWFHRDTMPLDEMPPSILDVIRKAYKMYDSFST